MVYLIVIQAASLMKVEIKVTETHQEIVDSRRAALDTHQEVLKRLATTRDMMDVHTELGLSTVVKQGTPSKRVPPTFIANPGM